MVKGRKLTSQEGNTIQDLLRSAVLPRDSLPYTDEFTALKQRFEEAAGRTVGEADFWQMLLRVGKRGISGPRKKGTPVPRLPVEDQLELLRLMPEGTGTRDRLPYTAEFGGLRRRFNAWTGRDLSNHDFWRAVSSLAKRSRKPRPVFAEAPLGGLPRRTIEILEFTNPWWRGMPAPRSQYYRRWAFHEAWRGLHNGLTPAVAIRGPRQVGKSTIEQQLIEHLLLIERLSPRQILHVQFDEVPQLGQLDQPIVSIVRWYEQHVLGESINGMARKGRPVYFLFDEVQNLRTWAAEMKSLVDHTTARVLITGSSSLRMAKEKDNLAGRFSWIDLGPLRLREIAGVRRLGELPAIPGANESVNWTKREFWLDLAGQMEKHSRALHKVFGCFSRLGGYPVCHKTPEPNREEVAAVVADSISRTIEGDVPVDPKGRSWDRPLLRHAFRQVCRYMGQSVRPQAIAQEINTIYQSRFSANDVIHAIQCFADAMLVHLVDPLEVALKRQSHPPRVCLCDHFVREIWLQEVIPILPGDLAGQNQTVAGVAGHVVESIVGYFLKGVPRVEVAWFPERKGEPEVDYVLTLGTQRIPIEVKYSRAKPKRGDCAGLDSFCGQKKYSAPFGLLLTQDTSGQLAESVIALPLSTFLAVL